MPEDQMRYDVLAQNALRNVVKDALKRVEKSGLPGQHHFFIQFNTRFSGVSIGERLSAKYPREMTVVLQHQFYNLQVHDEYFQVELSFDGIPEKLVIPFAAIKGFLDPAVQFGLQFEVSSEGEPLPTAEEPAKAGRALKTGKKEPAEEKIEPEAELETPKVVMLDAFRKK